MFHIPGDSVATGETITDATTARTFALTDSGDTIKFTSASAVTATVPPNSSVAFAVGDKIGILPYGAGVVTVAEGSGVTINSLDGSLVVGGQYGGGYLEKISTDEWLLLGVTEIGGETITDATTSRTFALTDSEDKIKFTSGSATTATVPPNSSVAFPIGTKIGLLAYGAGVLTIAEGSGVTINSLDDNLALSGQNASAYLEKINTDEWLLVGALA